MGEPNPLDPNTDHAKGDEGLARCDLAIPPQLADVDSVCALNQVTTFAALTVDHDAAKPKYYEECRAALRAISALSLRIRAAIGGKVARS
jgi:hypothetical protein